MGNKIDLRISKTKNSLYEAFIELIQKEAYSEITISQIAATARIDRRTFYLHYSSIDDLKAEMQERARKMIIHEMVARGNYRLETFIDSINKILENKIDFYTAIFKDPECDTFIQECVDSLAHCLYTTYAENNLSETSKKYYSYYISSGVIGMYVKWLRNEKENIDIKAFSVIVKKTVLDSSKIL